ncbi:MAG: 2-oxoglutarate dehydrogenase E1 component [Litorivicinaceae bacterium]|nr:2-oxoglutarate dehydrogenase E1 component [Litorivicinaceae bacterium]MDP5340097.1 2-oxoglutarate dehydrogenase E1 component [Litorivicinaceae bacterium]
MSDGSLEQRLSTSHLAGGNLDYLDGLFEQYLQDSNSVPMQWRQYFDGLPRVEGAISGDVSHATIQSHFLMLAKNRRRAMPVAPGSVSSDFDRKQVNVQRLMNAYRLRGHQRAHLDPLGLMDRERVPDLELGFHQLCDADLDTTFQLGVQNFNRPEAPLRDIIALMEQTYCRSVGSEYMHIVDTEERLWLQSRIEAVQAKPNYPAEIKTHLLQRLTAAEGLEKYLQSRYPGTKRFGLEGGESLVPCIDELIQRAGALGAKEIVIGMAHRGRLNLLVNTFGKSPKDLFDEFDGKATYDNHGDVKYHQGFSSNVTTPGGEVHLAMAFNPSHLEIVSPVVEGSVRARQDRRSDPSGDRVVPIAIHGDAAFAGQGVVMETFQMSQTRAFKTGGTIHIIVNNQVGFTTSVREDTRSTEYCTDIAKMVQAPILHVNADDPEAVNFVTQLAMDYRYAFKKDIVIDLICYRRRGHNEADEPSATQPLMYAVIKHLKTTRQLYADHLVSQGVLSAAEVAGMEDGYRDALDRGEPVVETLVRESNAELFVDWRPYFGHAWTADADTSFDLARLKSLALSINTVPAGFMMQKQVEKVYEDRRKMASGTLPCNWGFAETLAYATLVDQNIGIRFTGQDVGRGTFSHRQAVLHEQNTGMSYCPLQHIADAQPRIDIYDSLLSEEAVLAFEYGYATTEPRKLVIWEAQFGDFANGAQVVIDQFITSGELKWGRLCGLTMLLPHGYEGQGPEHSSARLERFLQLCAEQNIQVCIPSTPAQVYHMLRRQIIRPLRKPLVVMSPKSLLRKKEAVSTLEELADGHFQTVIQDMGNLDPQQVKKVIICSGKVYYDLEAHRAEMGITDRAILRIEQIYPFPEDDLVNALAPYVNMEELIWCQEEPMNQGAWYSSQHHMLNAMWRHAPNKFLRYAGRAAAATPAAGYMALHVAQQQALIQDALEG